MAPARPRSRSGAAVFCAAAMVVLAGACTSLWGIDQLQYDGTAAPTTSVSTGGATGTSSTTSPTTSSTSHSGAGGSGTSTTSSSITSSGGAAPCEGCALCVLPGCELAQCPDVASLCEVTVGCLPLAECMLACGPLDATCQTACIDAAPAAAPVYQELFDCSACATQQCGPLCAEHCGTGCSLDGQDCLECINSECVDEVCAANRAACSAKPECLDLATCLADCADEACEASCAAAHVEGLETYNSLVRCAVCTRPACWVTCSEEGANCEGFG